MAKDPTDYSTVDFIPPVLNVARGQVLMNRQQQIAIVAKKGRACAHLVQMKSGVLKVAKYTAGELIEEWSEAECSLDRALAKLLELGKQHGITDAARNVLGELSRTGREPMQHNLFG